MRVIPSRNVTGDKALGRGRAMMEAFDGNAIGAVCNGSAMATDQYHEPPVELRTFEFLARRKEKWRNALRNVLLTEGDIVERAEQAEDEVEN